MNEIAVPGHDIRFGADAVVLEWETNDNLGLRAVFARDGEQVTLARVETRSRPPHPMEDPWSLVPQALVDQLRLRGFEIEAAEAEERADQREEEPSAVPPGGDR